MSALRLARACTRRNRVLKFAGGYHGHADPFLADAGSGLATLGIPASPGVPSSVVAETIVVDYNDVERSRPWSASSKDLAAVFVEPVAGNMGCIPPAPGFLEALRALCDVSGALLVFDEVITGFRVARGGAQERYGVLPDLTVLGKIVGGGLPLAAFGGRAEIMSRLAPAGDVYQAGTLSGNPLATAAGLSVLRRLRDPAVYDELERRGARLEAGLAPYGRVQRVGAMLTLLWGRVIPVIRMQQLTRESRIPSFNACAGPIRARPQDDLRGLPGPPRPSPALRDSRGERASPPRRLPLRPRSGVGASDAGGVEAVAAMAELRCGSTCARPARTATAMPGWRPPARSAATRAATRSRRR